jgi:serine/threonine protein kinase
VRTARKAIGDDDRDVDGDTVRVSIGEVFSFDVVKPDAGATAVALSLFVRPAGAKSSARIGPPAAVLFADISETMSTHTVPVGDGCVAHCTSRLVPVREPVAVSDFDKLKVLGIGSFGTVLQVRKRDTGRLYAMKVINKKRVIERNALESLYTERRIMEYVESPFVVSLKYAMQTKTNLYFFLDFIPGGELYWHLNRAQRFDEELARFYAAELALALSTLHGANIIYRDLKPENVLLDATGHVCLCDFGLSKDDMQDSDKAYAFCGSPEYIAPEMLMRLGYGKAVDWWSFGVLLYEMLSGLPPFYSEDTELMDRMILTKKLEFPPYFSEDACVVLAALLTRNPRSRLQSLGELRRTDFFAPVDFDALAHLAVQPPYTPQLGGDSDLQFFDPMFTEMELPNLSPRRGSRRGSDTRDAAMFQSFSYTAPPERHFRRRSYVSPRHGTPPQSPRRSPKRLVWPGTGAVVLELEQIIERNEEEAGPARLLRAAYGAAHAPARYSSSSALERVVVEEEDDDESSGSTDSGDRTGEGAPERRKPRVPTDGVPPRFTIPPDRLLGRQPSEGNFDIDKLSRKAKGLGPAGVPGTSGGSAIGRRLDRAGSGKKKKRSSSNHLRSRSGTTQ